MHDGFKLHIGRGLIVWILCNIFMMIICKIDPGHLECNTMTSGILYSMLCMIPGAVAAVEID